MTRGETHIPDTRGLAFAPTDERFTLVIPAFNEGRHILPTLRELRAQPGLEPERCEIIVVDDGSTDESGDLLKGLDSELCVRVFRHEANRGYGAALKSGVLHATNELIAITDADGTYPNERLPELVRIARDYDMVVGARVGENVAVPFARRFPKWLLGRFANWMVGRTIPDLNSGMRVFRRGAVMRFISILPDTFSFTTTITLAMLTNNYTVCYESIDYKRRVGRSKIRPIRDTLLFTQLILRTGFYFAPLRVFGPVVALLLAAAGASVAYDFAMGNLTDKSVVLIVATFQAAMFTLLADMIDKRTGRWQ